MRDAKAILDYLDTVFDEEAKSAIAAYVDFSGDINGCFMKEALGSWLHDLLVESGRLK